MRRIATRTVAAAVLVMGGIAGCVDVPPPREDSPSPPDMTVESDAGCVARAEICDGADDDCDGLIDEDFDLQYDEANCGTCGARCDDLPNTEARCVAGVCAVLACTDGFLDCTDEAGCETGCLPTGDELMVCNGIDEDCDCEIDEAVATADDVNNCGGCGVVCRTPGFNADPGCVEGHCVIATCDPGFFNPDGQLDTGCPCRQREAGVDLMIPAAPDLSDAKVAYPGEGADGLVAWTSATDGGLTVEHRGIDAVGYWTGQAEQTELERAEDAEFIDLVALGAGRFGVLWTNGRELWVRRLGDPTSSMLFDVCNLGAETCEYAVVDGAVIAARLEVRGELEEARTAIFTSEGARLGEDFEGRRNDLPFQSMACVAVDSCIVVYRDGDGLFAATPSRARVLDPAAISDASPVAAVDGGYLTVWAARRDGGEGSTGMTLNAAGETMSGPHPLNLEGVVNLRRLVPDSRNLPLFWQNEDMATGYVALRADGTRETDSEAFAIYPSGAIAPRIFYDQRSRIETLDGDRITDGVHAEEPIEGRVKVSGGLDAESATLVYARNDGDFMLSVSADGLGDVEQLFTHRGGVAPIHMVQVGNSVFALRIESDRLRWATRVANGPFQRAHTPLVNAPTPLDSIEAALMPWDTGVLAALTLSASGADGQQTHQLELSRVGSVADVPAQLPLALAEPGHEIAPRLAGPGSGRGALLLTNRLVPRQPGAELRLYRIDGVGNPDDGTIVANLATRGLHAVVYSPPSDRTFVLLADDLQGEQCARGVGIQVFDGDLAPTGAPVGGLDLRATLDDLEALGERCIDAVTAAPNQEGGITATLHVGADFWLVNFNRDGLRMGEAQRWAIGARGLTLWPQANGARAFWPQGAGVRTVHLGCE